MKDCSGGYHFEPSVAEKTFLDMLGEYPSIRVLYGRQFDCYPENVEKEGESIRRIRVLDREKSVVEE